jgi:Oxidoreductase family, NAD-binding Rossmann fold
VELKCARVGYGKIARIHEHALARLGVRTIAILETRRKKRELARAAGRATYTSYADVADLHPDFWDVCTPTDSHVPVLEAINACDPHAHVVIEKPICHYDDLPALNEVLARHRGQVAVNENYASSAVSEAVAVTVRELGLRPLRVVAEMSKHRGHDFLAGRFVDVALGAFGYEGTHLLAVVGSLGPEYLKGTPSVLNMDDAYFPEATDVAHGLDGAEVDRLTGWVKLPRQGGAFVVYDTADGCRVELYTSMSGMIGFPCPPYAPPVPCLGRDDLSRYRILRVDGVDATGAAHQVVGFFEPLPGLPRGRGALAVFREGAMLRPVTTVDDDSITRHFGRILDHFGGRDANPCSAEQGIEALVLLHSWVQEWIDHRLTPAPPEYPSARERDAVAAEPKESTHG